MWLALVAASLLGGADTLHADKRAPECPDLAARPFELKQMADGIYVRKGKHEIYTIGNRGGVANISIIIGDASVAVVDTGGSYCDGERFLKAIRQITKKPISHIIITHTHPDHTFGTAAFLGENPAIIGHANLPRAMMQKSPGYLTNLENLVGKKVMQNTRPVPPNRLVKDSLTIDLGERILRLDAHPTAHTDHDLTVLDMKTRTLWTGDLLFHEHIPVVDGSLLGWRRVIEKMKAMGAENVIPGHGGPLLPAETAFTPQSRYLDNLISDLRTIIKEGGTMLEAQKNAANDEKQAWTLFEEFNARNASTGFAELEWE